MNMNKLSVAVIGQGFVGGSLTTVLNERNIDVYVYDKTGKIAPGGVQPELFCERKRPLLVKSTRQVNSIEDLVEFCEHRDLKNFSGIYFVCLPTPMFEDGSADLSIVEDVLNCLSKVDVVNNKKRIAVVKSTVPPGSTEKWNEQFKNSGLRIIFSPEFLRESTALDDMRNQDRIILGGPRPQINKVKEVFKHAFQTVKIVKTSSTNAELTKYVTNCFLAMKVSFANELYQICEALAKNKLDVDYDRVIECASMDKRLGTSHWNVPSFETDDNGNSLFGFSLSCFPKDLNALIVKARELGVNPTLLEATWKKNLEVRPGKDWEQMVGRAISKKSNAV